MIGSVDEFILFAKSRGVIVTPEAGAAQLQKASDYINLQKWIGELVDEDQEDEWPRILPGVDSSITDDEGNPLLDDVTIISGVTPKKILTATYRLAMAAAKIDLMPSFGGPAIVEKRIEGAIDVKYAEQTLQSAPIFDWFEPMVAKWLDGESESFQFKVRRG